MSQAVRRPSAALCGLGCSAFDRSGERSARALAAQAVVAAVVDAGLTASDIDGLVLARSPLATGDDLPLRLQVDLALADLSLLCAVDASGASFIEAIQTAVLAVAQGQARRVACVFADAPIRPGVTGQKAFSRPMPLSGVPNMEAQAGLFGAAGAFALMASAWLDGCGADERTLFAHVEASGRWAAGNPLARRREAMSFDDYRASPFVVAPLRVADCAYPVNGAICVVVTAADSPATSRHGPVYVHAMAQAHGGRADLAGRSDEAPSGAAAAARRLYAAAGIGPDDVSMLQAYDAFSVLGPMAVVDYGFCAATEVAAFMSSGCTAPGGSLAVNTGGGHGSGFYLQGATPVHEAMVQLRGEGGARQADVAGPVVVTGVGGRYEHHAALLLSREDRR